MTQPSPKLAPGAASGLLAPVLAALMCVAMLVASWKIFVGTRRGQLLEQAAMDGAFASRDRFEAFTLPFLQVVGIPFLVVVVALAVAIAVLQKRWSIAIATVVLIAGANLTTQILKGWGPFPGLTRPEFEGVVNYGNSWPSGHSTVAASVAAAALLISPPRWRAPVALVGALYAGITGWGTIMAGWHRPSDVVAACAVAALWYFLVEAARTIPASAPIPRGYRGAPTRNTVRVLFAVAGIFGAVGLGILGAIALTMDGPGRVPRTLAYIGALCGVLAAAAFLAMSMLAMRPHHSAAYEPLRLRRSDAPGSEPGTGAVEAEPIVAPVIPTAPAPLEPVGLAAAGLAAAGVAPDQREIAHAAGSAPAEPVPVPQAGAEVSVPTPAAVSGPTPEPVAPTPASPELRTAPTAATGVTPASPAESAAPESATEAAAPAESVVTVTEAPAATETVTEEAGQANTTSAVGLSLGRAARPATSRTGSGLTRGVLPEPVEPARLPGRAWPNAGGRATTGVRERQRSRTVRTR